MRDDNTRVSGALVRTLFLLSISIHWISCQDPYLNISKRERYLVGLIERNALSFQLEKFAKDPVLLQTGTFLRYISPRQAKKNANVILKKKHPDFGKVSIVLSSAENRFAIPTPRGQKKRQFILLRRAGSSSKNPEHIEYHTSFIYVRNLYPNDTNRAIFNVDGVDTVVEFDIWEQRPRKFFAGWTNCDFSLVFTCASQKDIQTDANAKAKARRRKREAYGDGYESSLDTHMIVRRHAQAPPPPPPPSSGPPLISFKGEPGYDPGIYNDLYLDLDFHRFDELFRKEIEVRKRSAVHVRGRRAAPNGKGAEGRGGKVPPPPPPARKPPPTGEDKVEGGAVKKEDSKKKARRKALNANSPLLRSLGRTVSGVVGGKVRKKNGGVMGAVARIKKRPHKIITPKKIDDDVNSQLGGGAGGVFADAEGGLDNPGAGGKNVIGGGAGEGAVGSSAVAQNLAGLNDGLGPVDTFSGFHADDGVGGPASGGQMVAADLLVPMQHTALQPVSGGGTHELGKQAPDLFAHLVHYIGSAAIAPIADVIGIGALLDNAGLGGVLDTAPGCADSVLNTADTILGTWDTIGNGIIEKAAAELTKMGVPADVAKLACLAAQLAFNVWTIIEVKGIWLGVRLGVDFVGLAANGGRYNGKGFAIEQSIPHNNLYIHGNLFPGAEEGKYFFMPEGCISRATFICNCPAGKVPGYFKPNYAGGPDMFWPDSDPRPIIGQTGRILPADYEASDKESTEIGIAGTFEPGFKFKKEVNKLLGVYKPGDPDWQQNVWLPPHLDDRGPKVRPALTAAGKKIIYGYIFNGIEDSPHIFIAEGDSVSGVFVPADPDRSGITETPHGIMKPSHPAGHALFIADDPREVINIHEIRGVFMPDAMHFLGGISGRLSKSEDCNCDIKYSFVLDRPATDFAYVAGEVKIPKLWSPYLAKEEWDYEPPSTPSVEPDAELAIEEEDAAPMKPSHQNPDEYTEDEKKAVSGLRIKTKKGVAFIPDGHTLGGFIFPVDWNKTYSPIQVQLTLVKQDEPFKLTIIKKTNPDEKLPSQAVVVLVPTGFPKEDGVAGFLNIDENGGDLKLATETTAHIWTTKDELWTPVGFKEKILKGDKAVEEAMAKLMAKETRKKDVKVKELIELEQQGVGYRKRPGTSFPGIPGACPIPPRRPLNLIMGRKVEEAIKTKSEEFLYDSMTPNPDAEYIHGFYMKSPRSRQPVFIPDTGIYGIFRDEKGNEGYAYYFPDKGKDLESEMAIEITKNPKSSPFSEGNKGKFYTVGKRQSNDRSKGFIRGTYEGEDLVAPDVDIIPGWQLAEQEPLSKDDLPKGSDVDPKHFLPLEKAGRYALVDVGGGFKGVIVSGVKALDDPNNPIFQEFLHYRAIHWGDVNPWGKVAIVNPIVRKGGNVETADDSKFGGNYTLGVGSLHESVSKNDSMAGILMKGFSLSNWLYPDLVDYDGGERPPPNLLGKRANVVNLLDFKMYLYQKYSCKRIDYGGKMIRLLVPKSSEPFLKVKKFLKPKDTWFQALQGNKLTCCYDSIAGSFAAYFNLDTDSVQPLTRPLGQELPPIKAGGAKNGTGDWKTTAPYLQWGDESSCDEIELDGFLAAQALASMTDEASPKTGSGICLGFELVKGRGNKIGYHKVSKKLLNNFERKMKEGEAKKKERENEANGQTDLTGAATKQAEVKTESNLNKESVAPTVAPPTTTPAPGPEMKPAFSLPPAPPPPPPTKRLNTSQVNDSDSESVPLALRKKKAPQSSPPPPPPPPRPLGSSSNSSTTVTAKVKKEKATVDQYGRIKGNATRVQGHQHAKVVAGWKTQYRSMIDNATLSEDGIVFYGLGNCEEQGVPDITLLESQKPVLLIKYYMLAMRIYCMHDAESRLLGLVNQGLLKLSVRGDSFDMPEDNPLLWTIRLTPMELKKLSVAFEFHALTKTYAKVVGKFQATGKLEARGVQHNSHGIMSRSVGFLTEMTFYTIQFGRKITPVHGVRLNRNMIVTLRTTMTKLQQDWIILHEKCKGCDFDKKLTEGDKYRIMSLIEFMIWGMYPYNLGEKTVQQAFELFEKLNRDAIYQRIEEFERQFPQKIKAMA